MLENFIPFTIPPGIAALLGIGFSDTITLGAAITGALVGVAGLVTFLYGARYKAAYEAEHVAASSLEDGRRAYQLRSERLEEELREQHKAQIECLATIGELKAVIATYEAQPKLGDVVKAIEKAVETSTARDEANFAKLIAEHGKTRELFLKLNTKTGV